MNYNKKIKIGKKTIQDGKSFIVAEVSANHGGSLTELKKLLQAIKKAGADAAKIQVYQANTITLNSKKKDFLIDKQNTWSSYKNLYSLYLKAQTPYSWLEKIFNYAQKIDLLVFASVFDYSGLKLLEKFNCPAYKIASPEITDVNLISKVAKTKKPIIVSNGLANQKDLELCVRTIKKTGNKNLVLLKCTSSYPAPINEINLATIHDLKKKYKCLVGYSDHTLGTNIPIHAASIGASVIEKHVKLSNKNKSVDDFFSITSNELAQMCKTIKLNETANGKINYQISKSSKKNLNGRRSLYVSKDIKIGERFSLENISSFRPTYGLHPKFLNNFLGKKSIINLNKGDRLSWKALKK